MLLPRALRRTRSAAAAAAAAASTRAISTRVAVIGGGPSGFYSAKYLLKEDPSVHVDVLDALPSPYGAQPPQ